MEKLTTNPTLLEYNDFFNSMPMAPVAVEEAMTSLSGNTGLPVDQVKLLLCLIVAVPLSFLFRAIPGASAKHIVSITIGVAMSWFCLGAQTLHSFFTSLMVYLLVALLPSKRSHYAVFFFTMIYMSASHIYRQYTDYMGWSMDFTGPQMIITIKLTTFAYNYHDGQLSDAEKEKKLHPEQANTAIKDLPSLLEFFSYVYFFGSYMAGPAFEIKYYLDYVNGDLAKKGKDGKLPLDIVGVLTRFVTAFLCAGVYQVATAKVPLAYTHSDEFLNHPMWWRVGYMTVSVILTRYKYYFAWSLADSSTVASGVAFNGYDKQGNVRWDRCKNMSILDVEMGQSMKQVTDHWNMGTAKWLKNCVYLRLAPVGTKPAAYVTVLTYMTSAFWHGFYPGYYLTFATGALITEVGKNMRRMFNHRAVAAGPTVKRIYDFGCLIAVMLSLNYAGAAFLLLDYGYASKAWGAVGFSTHLVLLPLFVLFLVMPPKSPKKAPKKDAAKEEPKKEK